MSCLYRDYRRVEGFEDYIISNYGEVYSLKGVKFRELKFNINRGYKYVILCEKCKKKTINIHILVGNAFIDKRTNGLEFDHIDRNPLNNRADNIRLATSSAQKVNTKTRTDNKLGIRCITKQTTNWGQYYSINIRRDKKYIFRKALNVEKYTLEDAIKIRDDFLTTSAEC